MLTIAVVIIAAIMVVANLDIIISLIVMAGILAAGLTVLIATIAIIVAWPAQVIGAFCALVVFCFVFYFLTVLEVNSEEKRENERQSKFQAKEHNPH